MGFLRRYRLPLLAILLLTLAAVPLVVVRWAANEVMSPPRRELQDYHHDFLSDLTAHGVLLDEFRASDGTPCLVVSPSGVPGERGRKLRDQLESRGKQLAPFGQVKGTLVLLHGRKGRKEDFLSIAERLCAIGFRCLIPDLPAHGDHPGEVATYGIREAAIPSLILKESASRFGFSPEPCGIMGMSMGGSVAVHAAALPDAPWKALIVIASFDSLDTTVEKSVKQTLGDTIGSWTFSKLKSTYQRDTGIDLSSIRPYQKATNVRTPVMVAHGTSDQVVPLASGQRLYDSFQNSPSRKWIEIPSAGHDNVLITDYPIYAEIGSWFFDHASAQ